MRAKILVLGCTVALLAAAAPAAGDNGPHKATGDPISDSCAGCHRVHTAKAPHLLKEAQSTLCYTCHGAAATGANTDVVDGVGYSGAGRTGTAGALRGGGFKYALIGSGSPEGNGYLGEVPVRSIGATVTSSHSVDESKQWMAWGWSSEKETPELGKFIPLRCGSCHDPHGNGNYRILRAMPKEASDRPRGSTAGDIVIPDTATKVYTTKNYWRVEDVNAPGFIANISAWCATCHTRYLASADSGKTASGDAVYAFRHRSDQTAQGSASCVQCHVSHGSNASMGPYSVGVANPDGSPGGSDSRLLRIDNRGVCQMCHSK